MIKHILQDCSYNDEFYLVLSEISEKMSRSVNKPQAILLFKKFEVAHTNIMIYLFYSWSDF